MAKYLCGMCGQIADEPFDHGTGELSPIIPEAEEPCGPWFDVTLAYRAGQEVGHNGAADKIEDYLGLGGQGCADAVRNLPLEGDDDV